MPTLHLIHGFVGTGKTTFARQLEAQGGGLRFSIDAWMVRLFGANPPAAQFAELEARVKAQIREVASAALRQGMDVILDFGFWQRTERDEYRQWAHDLGADCKLYALTCPAELSHQRVLARSQSAAPDQLIIDANAIESFKQRFEPVGEEEGAIEISTQA